MMTERQNFVLNNPCHLVDDCGKLGYVAIQQAGAYQIVTVLTIDLFEYPWRWHAAVGFVGKDKQPVPCALWDYNDRSVAVETAKDLLRGVGAGSQEGGLVAAGVAQLHVKRDLRGDERLFIEAMLCEMAMPIATPQITGKYEIVDPRADH